MDPLLVKILKKYEDALDRKDLDMIQDLSLLLHNELFDKISNEIPQFIQNYNEMIDQYNSLDVKFDLKGEDIQILKKGKVVKSQPLIRAENLVYFLQTEEVGEESSKLSVLFLSNPESTFSLNIIIAMSDDLK